MYSTRAESGEKLPKRATSSDMTGEKKVRVPKADKEYGGVPSTTGAKSPKGATSSDTSGERKAPIMGGVGMGKADGMGMRPAAHAGHHDGRMGEMNDGSKEREVYSHVRVGHAQEM